MRLNLFRVGLLHEVGFEKVVSTHLDAFLPVSVREGLDLDDVILHTCHVGIVEALDVVLLTAAALAVTASLSAPYAPRSNDAVIC